MNFAFRHLASGTVAVTADADGHNSPDWEPLPAPPTGDGPWEWDGAGWYRDAAPALAALRIERDRRLVACDWTQLADAPAATRNAWQPYRQSLRDLPDVADPFAPEWPTPPES